MKRLIFLAVGILIFPFEVFSNDRDYVINNYDKAEYQIPMRDGLTLYTIVYTPKNKK